MTPLDDAFSSVALAASRAELLKGVSRIAAAVGYDHVALAYRAPLKSAFGDAARGAQLPQWTPWYMRVASTPQLAKSRSDAPHKVNF